MVKDGNEIDYVIRIKGRLDPRRRSYFDAREIATEDGVTTITGRVADQSALHGLLGKIRDMGLPLLSVACDDPRGDVR